MMYLISTLPSYPLYTYSPHWGMLMTPSTHRQIPTGVPWAIDNEAFTRKFRPEMFFAYLEKMKPYQDSCLFVTVPDVVCNAIATQHLFRQYAWQIKVLDWPIAFVAQDGQESLPFPPEFDALFIGGSTQWKLSAAADFCIRYAQARGKWVHIGRVNSQRRIRHFQLVGADSCDGTSPIFAPDRNYKTLNTQLIQEPLFTL